MKKSLLDYTLKIRIPLVAFVAIGSFIGTYYLSRAERDGVGYAPEQPIPFSHKLHAGTMDRLRYCHTRDSSAATVPVSMHDPHTVARKPSCHHHIDEVLRRRQAVPWNGPPCRTMHF
jgi:hypothetical protein